LQVLLRCFWLARVQRLQALLKQGAGTLEGGVWWAVWSGLGHRKGVV
jgi:hypothetical protein